MVPMAMKLKVQGKKVEMAGEDRVQAEDFSKAQETVKQKAVFPSAPRTLEHTLARGR